MSDSTYSFQYPKADRKTEKIKDAVERLQEHKKAGRFVGGHTAELTSEAYHNLIEAIFTEADNVVSKIIAANPRDEILKEQMVREILKSSIAGTLMKEMGESLVEKEQELQALLRNSGAGPLLDAYAITAIPVESKEAKDLIKDLEKDNKL